MPEFKKFYGRAFDAVKKRTWTENMEAHEAETKKRRRAIVENIKELCNQ